MLLVMSPVHPRVCGEQSTCPDSLSCFTGSSPRVRGTGLTRYRPGWSARFIPACAGNSVPVPAVPVASAVHPRVCGEQGVLVDDQLDACGSSPRVRGTGRVLVRRSWLHRFIPACAGNSRCCRCCWRRGAVHPRVCGEQSSLARRANSSPGSSPRVRGTAHLRVPGMEPHRFIPACAGNSCRGQGRPIPSAVHPRVCGEQIVRMH